MREIPSYVDGLASFSLGRPDAWLIDLYRKDIASGALTEEAARDLVARWLIVSDEHMDSRRTINSYSDQEAEMPVTLGGCDADGRPVWNELTEMFLDAHIGCDCVFPKLHVRFGAKSPEAYLAKIADMVIKGHCVFAMFNDKLGMTPKLLTSIFRVFAKKRAHLLQPNCNSVEELLDAQAHPERHQSLMVKVCGFSARFVSLSKRWQDEVIARHRLR